MKTCHKAGDEQHKTSNRVKIDHCPSALQLYSHPLGAHLARETGVDEKARTFDEWSQIVSLCYALHGQQTPMDASQPLVNTRIEIRRKRTQPSV